MNGGLEIVSRYCVEKTIPIRNGAEMTLTESGPPMKLMEKYGLSKSDIVSR